MSFAIALKQELPDFSASDLKVANSRMNSPKILAEVSQTRHLSINLHGILHQGHFGCQHLCKFLLHLTNSTKVLDRGSATLEL